MGYVKDVKIGETTHLIEPILYSVTAGTSSAITADIANFELQTGVAVKLKITTANVASATLNVSGTGAKQIRYNNAAIAKNKLRANYSYEFVYDGTYWQLVGELDTNTTYSFDGGYSSSTNKGATVSTVTNAINNITIGGRNLLLDSDVVSTATVAAGGTSAVTGYYYLSEYGSALAVEGAEFTASFDYEVNTQTTTEGYIYTQFNGSQTTPGYRAVPDVIAAPSGKAFVTFNVTAAQAAYGDSFRLRLRIQSSNEGASFKVWNLKLERGNKPTDWEPAIEDLNQEEIFNRLTDNDSDQGLSLNNGKISVNADYISGIIGIEHGGFGSDNATGARENIGAVQSLSFFGTDGIVNIIAKLETIPISKQSVFYADPDGASLLSGGKVTSTYRGIISRQNSTTFDIFGSEGAGSRMSSGRVTTTSNTITTSSYYRFSGTAI